MQKRLALVLAMALTAFMAWPGGAINGPPLAFADHGNYIYVQADGPSGTNFRFNITYTNATVCTQQTPFTLQNGETQEMQCRDGAAARIVATTPSGNTLDSIACHAFDTGDTRGQQSTISDTNAAAGDIVVKITDNEHVRCIFTFSEKPTRPNITIVKDAPGARNEDFRFSISGTGSDCDESFRLEDNDQATFNCEFPGTYTVRETDQPSDWELRNISCTDVHVSSSDVTVDNDNGRVRITLTHPEDRVTCTFHNRVSIPSGPNVTIVKDAPGAGNLGFTFSISGTGSRCDDYNFRLTDNDSADYRCDVPGTYTVREIDSPSGWYLTDISCRDVGVASNDIDIRVGDERVTITLRDVNDRVTCTFENDLSAVEGVSEVVVPTPAPLSSIVISAPAVVTRQSISSVDIYVWSATGAPVADNTPVYLTTTYGSVLPTTVYTSGGHAIAWFYGTVDPGMAVITARAETVSSQTVVCVETCAAPLGALLQSTAAQCNTSVDGRGTMTFAWQPTPGAVVQWLDLSLYDNGFASGTFLGAGPLTPDSTALNWSGILPGLPHYWRVNSLMPDGTWRASATGVFYPCYGQ